MNHQKFDALAIEYDFVSEIFNNNDFFCPTYCIKGYYLVIT
jgi:hypothetical protein